MKIATEEKEVENGTTNVELVKREVVSEGDPSNSNLKNQSEKMKMATLEAEVKNDLANGVRSVELVKREVVSKFGPSNSTLNNQSEKDVEKRSLKSATGPSNSLKNQSEKESLNSEKSRTKSYRSGQRYMELPSGKEKTNEGIPATGPSTPTLDNQSEKKNLKSEKSVEGYVELPAGKEISNVPSNTTETRKIATVEAEVENGTTNQPEKITNENGAEKTSLMYEKSESKSNVSGDLELPERVLAYLKTKSSSIEYGPIYEELLNQKELASDPNELKKIEHALEREASKVNEQRSTIYAKEDPEAGAEIGKKRVREVFHMDVAELIIERDA